MKTQIAGFFICLSILFSFSIDAQHLNFAGHIIDNSSGKTNDEFNKPFNVRLKGPTQFRTTYGFVTITSHDDDALSVLRIYNSEGKQVKKLSFRQTINFSFSPDRTFAAFHDTKNIQLINFSDNSSQTFEGTNVYAFSKNNSFAFFDSKKQIVNLNGKEFFINENVVKLAFLHETLLVGSKTKLISVEDDKLKDIFYHPSENIFDLKTIDNKIYFSTKKTCTDRFDFKIYSSSDLQKFTPGETTTYPLKNFSKIKRSSSANRSLPPGEQIRNPIYYFQDTVYQPVGNSYDEIQDYSGGVSIYPHPGVDLLGYFMQDVVSVKTGIVKAVLTTSAQYHWRIAIGNENTTDFSTGYLYAHLEELSIPYTVGDSVNEGDVIGYLVDFPVAGFVHCHFARIYDEGFVWNGGWWTYDNPLSYMTNFYDSLPPVFEKTIGNDEFAFRDSLGIYLSPDSLYGNIKIISKVYDQINSSWHVDVNKLRYNMSPLASPLTFVADTFAYEFNFYNDNYNSGPYAGQLLRTIYSLDQTCFSTGNYTDRNFYHIITNSNGNDTIEGADSLLFFDTRLFPDGDYIFRVIASDPSGNTTTDSMIIKIRNLNNRIYSVSELEGATISPNPFTQFLNINLKDVNSSPENLFIKDVTGRTVYFRKNLIGTEANFFQIDLNELIKGVYFLYFENAGKFYSAKVIRN